MSGISTVVARLGLVDWRIEFVKRGGGLLRGWSGGDAAPSRSLPPRKIGGAISSTISSICEIT
jgi:hypothetical protein